MKAYITKYALTRGIIESTISQYDNNLVWVQEEGFNDEILMPKKFVFDNIEHAKQQANDMRLLKIASLEKQIEILKNKTF